MGRSAFAIFVGLDVEVVADDVDDAVDRDAIGLFEAVLAGESEAVGAVDVADNEEPSVRFVADAADHAFRSGCLHRTLPGWWTQRLEHATGRGGAEVSPGF